VRVENVFTTETAIRTGCFAGVLFVMALGEIFAPRRQNRAHKLVRWISNLGLVALSTVAIRVILPLGAAGVAMLVQERGWGVLNVITLPDWAEILIAVAVLDFVIYLQHVLLHAVPALWRLHMVHHADLDFDVTTGVRFHTLEILLSMGVKLAAVAVIGPAPIAVVAFEILLNATSMFSHSNVRFPLWLDRILRLIVVTPDMHRVHHSDIVSETNSNYGFNLPWWDFLLGTYRDQPAAGHEDMTIGLRQFRDNRMERLDWMLILPFVAAVSENSRDRRLNGAQPFMREDQPMRLETQATTLPLGEHYSIPLFGNGPARTLSSSAKRR
jgi:sterol desaturase/sphingolipid hydroxylase (fatty acid hydroxylase superfamily)